MSAAAAQIDVSKDPEALAGRVASWLCGLAQAGTGKFAVCLSGGSTPRRLYQLLAAAPLVGRMPWARVHWFWGDERFVPWDHKDSNYRMASEAMLGHVPVPRENIHGIPFTGTPEEAAAGYERELKSFYGADGLDPSRALFDVTLLGMGPDGHTASLLPGSDTLAERTRWVAPVTKGRPEARITLTFPALDSSRHVAFVAAGADKKGMMDRVLAGEAGLPAAQIRPTGVLHWFVDEAARKGG
jgi:6-phosphogluconolactonase